MELEVNLRNQHHEYGAERVLGGIRPEPGLSEGQCQAHANDIGKSGSKLQTQHKHCCFAELA
jgi:hypothetical protein